MTFFVKETPAIPARGPNVPLPSNSDGVGAAVTSYFREIDSFNGAQAYTDIEKANVGKGAGERIGIDELNRWYQENDAGYDHLRKPPKTVDEFIAMHGQRGSDMILDIARERATTDPDGWKDMDLSPEGIEARVTEQLKAAANADAVQLALSPNPVRNALVGGLAAGVLDPVNLAAIPFGLGGGSFLRVVGREMLINGTIEALQHPARARTAERLETEAPSFIASVAMGAAFGGVAAGLLDGLPRGLRALAYRREATKTEPAPDVGPVTQEAAIRKAEAAISEGKPGAQAAADEILREPAPPRRPLILDDSTRVPDGTLALDGSMRVQPEPTPLAPDPIATEPLAPVEGIPNTVDQITATAKTAINKGGRPVTKEVLGWLKKQGVDPDGWLGKELKSRGLSNKTNRGLFRKGGLTDADNIVAGEVDQSIGGISYRAGTDDTGMYLDREGIIRLVEEEISGPRKAYNRDYVPERAWADPDPEDRGFLVNDLEARKFAEPERWREVLETEVDTYLDSKGVILLPRERAEIKEVAATRGGDIDDLVYSATSRDIDEAEQAQIRAMRGEAYGRTASDVPWGEEAGMGPVPDRAGGSPAGEPEASPGNAPAVGARNLEPAGIERTDIGDQYLIPDTRRVETGDKQRQKAELEARQLQSKIGRLNQARVEDDVDGLFAARSLDMFDDLTSPEAREFMDANIQGMRDMLDEGNFETSAVADDGLALNKLSDILDEIDESRAARREYAKCRKGATE